ncbi:MAG TPA: DUF72 domain-containing protein, partial [Rubrivivax sp.]|nr:DUF72 domain-containing protein [Rubrivivax sp.]
SFKSPEYVSLARRHGVTTVFTDSDDYPAFADVTGGFVYARVIRTQPQWPAGCSPEVFGALASCARSWREGDEPAALPRVMPALPPGPPRDVFLIFISAAKEKAPAAAMALLQSLG